MFSKCPLYASLELPLLNGSFAILKARYSFRLYIHINIPENKTKMVFMYWLIWFYTSLYILKMMQIVCIIASEARWWCRWWGWPQLKPTTHDQPQRIPLHQKGFHPDKSRVLFQVLFSGQLIIDIWYTLFNYRKCHGLNFFIYR